METSISFQERLDHYGPHNTVPHKAWVSDWDTAEKRWSMPVLQPESIDNPAVVAAEYVESLDEEDRPVADNFFQGGGGPVVWFFCRDERQGMAAYLRQTVGHHSPILVSFTDRGNIKLRDLSPAHPLLARFLALRGYDWTTPEYRELCADFALDPDYRRPMLLPRHEEMGGRILQWIGRHLADREIAEKDPGYLRLQLARDMVTVLTSAGHQRPADIRELVAALRKRAPGRLPCREEFLQAITGEMQQAS